MKKWLKLGEPYTRDELLRFENLEFWNRRMGLYAAPGLTHADEETYQLDLDLAVGILGSAIESLTLKLLPDELRPKNEPMIGPNGSKFGSLNIEHAGQVVVGDRNSIQIDQRTTVELFFEALQSHIRAEVPELQRTSLLDKAKELIRHPAFLTILGQGLPEILKRIPPT